MTLEEKVSQMTYASSALPRFGIPEYNWWNECLHGVARAGTATMFPQPIGMAASFDADKLGETARIISDEARIKHHAAAAYEDRGIYKGLTMWTPNINIFRDPRWGRGHETYGEDPFLTAQLGAAFIRGLQGDDTKYYKCIATAKHFAVHSGPESERHTFDVHPSKKDLAETYLPAFEKAVREAGVYSVMGAYNRVFGESASGSKFLLTEVLRDTWGFSGYVVSDCGAVEDIWVNHKIVGTPEEAAAIAVKNGCDLCCGMIFPHLLEAVKQGLIEEETITRSAYRLLLARMKLGMFDEPANQPYANLSYELLDSEAHHQKSLEMARDSIVLLKNDGILPLDAGKIKTVAVVGPNADNRAALIGNYAGTPSITYTVLEGLRQIAPGVRFIYAQGCKLNGGSDESGWGDPPSFRIAEAMHAAQIADVTILVTGLTGESEGEEGYGSGDRESMNLPESQLNLIEALSLIDKPMIWLNMTGSATLFPHDDRFGAIAQVWYPGQMGGLAVADIIFGNVSPSGRLPITFYKSMEQIPDFRDYSMKGRTYRYLTEEAAYPFGYGLSYTEFEYRDIRAEKSGGGWTVRATVANIGARAGKEVAQVYAQWINPVVETPLRQLVGVKTIELNPGESCEIAIDIPEGALQVIDEEGRRLTHDGEIILSVGGGQPDARTLALTGREAPAVRVNI
ncbi:MAG: glycoside hydrolase family 3 C-terminal domain-containing protein [Oscillospiraceae bacterium]|nr:glycoside hydrolase family 3 C-terminal domain-containing protein [Oscillospiraceae bacterium]